MTVPNVPPNNAEMNFPRSLGGDHLEIRLWSDGYKTPLDLKEKEEEEFQ